LSVERCTLNTPDGNAALTQIIRDQIENVGPQSFAWFMQQALYHPEHGYYASGRCTIGRKGDYFTNVSVGPLFGQLLTAQFAEIWERLGKMNDFVIVEQGAHDGQFARDVLEFAREKLPEFFESLRYRILEPFPILKEHQRRNLEMFGDKVEWPKSPQPFTGIHFSNELLDALPVRLIDNATEKIVALDGDNFVFIERPLSQGAAASRLPGDSGSFNQATLDWIDEIAAYLQRGYIIAIDYGRKDDDFHGSVQVRARHRNLDSPFQRIGHVDITMSVDWKSIIERAQANGLLVAGFTDQHHFLTGILSLIQSDDLGESLLADSPKAKRELQTLLHPEMLGRAFQVLALGKNVDIKQSPLAGFKFARQLIRSG
jgi:SAM-dependent MidA family methyltransferase